MIGEFMLGEFIAHPAFAVASCWDLGPQICEQVNTKYPGVPITKSGDLVLEHPEVELIYIATPPTTHVDYGLKFIEIEESPFYGKTPFHRPGCRSPISRNR